MRIRLLVTALTVVCLLSASRPATAQDDPPAEPDHVVLQMEDGSFIVGQIMGEDGGKITIDAGLLGTLTIDAEQVTARLDPAQFAADLATHTQQAPTGGSVPDFAPTAMVAWTRTFSLGGSYMGAPYKQGVLIESIPQLTGEALGLIGNQTQAQATMNIVRASRRGVLFIEGSQNYAYTEPIGKVAGTLELGGGYNFALRRDGRVYGVTKYTFRHDKIREIDYSHVGIAGIGYTAVMQRKVKFDIVPGLAIIDEQKGTAFDDRLMIGLGVIEELMIQPAPVFTIEQRVMYYQAAEDSEFWGLEAYLGLRGMLTKVLGIQVGITHTHDNVLETRPTIIPPNRLFPGQPQLNLLANNSAQTFITTGISVRW